MKKGGIILACLALVALILVVVGCSPPPPVPSDFNLIFKYGVGAKNELNTFSGTYTKDMIGPPFFIDIRLSLSQEDLSRIWHKMIEKGFFEYPDEFSVFVPTGGPLITTEPYYNYYFRVEYDAKVKELRWNDSITNKDEQADKLRALIQLIWDIIKSKEEYKKLPEPTSAYS